MSEVIQSAVCDFSRREMNLEPFPHVLSQQFIDSDRYLSICETFPSCPPKIGPTGFSLYWGDEGYQQLLDTEPAWRELFETFHSQRFIDWCREQFVEVWEREGCKIKLSEARYVPYCEDRIDKERAQLRHVVHEPHELWVRMDIHQGPMGYDRPVHLDHARRLMSMALTPRPPAIESRTEFPTLTPRIWHCSTTCWASPIPMWSCRRSIRMRGGAG